MYQGQTIGPSIYPAVEDSRAVEDFVRETSCWGRRLLPGAFLPGGPVACSPRSGSSSSSWSGQTYRKFEAYSLKKRAWWLSWLPLNSKVAVSIPSAATCIFWRTEIISAIGRLICPRPNNPRDFYSFSNPSKPVTLYLIRINPSQLETQKNR